MDDNVGAQLTAPTNGHHGGVHGLLDLGLGTRRGVDGEMGIDRAAESIAAACS